jgi:uncharacterized protein
VAGPAAILRELHRLRRHARDLQNEIERGPRMLKAHEAKVAREEESVHEAHERIKRLKVQTHEKEVSLKEKQQQIAKHEQQMNQATSKKEYDALRGEIANERKAYAAIEDQILEVMGQVEDETNRLPQLERVVQQAKQEVHKVTDDVQTRRDGLTDSLNQVHQQIKEMESSLPADIRTQYERLVAAMGEGALSLVQGRTCTACYTEITAQSYNELLQQQFVPCKVCGRILYLPE